MFNIKLEKKSHNMYFKALPVKIQQSKNRRVEAQCVPIPGAVRVKHLCSTATCFNSYNSLLIKISDKTNFKSDLKI